MERGCLRHFHVHLVIHYDPVVTEDPQQQELKEQVSLWLADYDPRLSVHDFRTVQGRRHQNVLFDISLPADLQKQEAAITAMLEQKLPDYHLIVTYDPETFNF